MLIYIINFLLILSYGLIIKDKKKFAIIASAQIFLILALRANTVGVDLDNYSAGYEYISGLNFEDMLSRLNFFSTADLVHPFAYESGYVVFNWLVALFGFDFHGFLVIHAAICTAVAGRFIYKLSDDVQLSFLMYLSMGFFMYSFGILRQVLAMSVFMLSIPLIKERKPIKFFLACILAFTIHRAAIIVFPLYFVYNMKMTRKKYVSLCLALVALLAVSPIIVNLAVKPLLVALGKTSYALSFSMNMYIVLMALIAVMILIFTSFDSLVATNQMNSLLCWSFLLAIGIEILGLYNDVLARAMYIPYIAVIALVPNVLKNYKHPGISVIGKGLLICLLFAFMLMQLNGSALVPYVFHGA